MYGQDEDCDNTERNRPQSMTKLTQVVFARNFELYHAFSLKICRLSVFSPLLNKSQKQANKVQLPQRPALHSAFCKPTEHLIRTFRRAVFRLDIQIHGNHGQDSGGGDWTDGGRRTHQAHFIVTGPQGGEGERKRE